MEDGRLEFRILGPLEVRAAAAPLQLRGAKVRGLLAALLLDANHPVSADRLIEWLWRGSPPANAHNALQAHVSQLRKVLGTNRLELRDAGYVLSVGDDELDAARFERLLGEGRRALDVGDAAAASRILGEALTLWRGPVLADCDLEPEAQAEAARLEELRAATREERIEADLRLGRHAELVAELEALVAAQPLRERLRGQLMLALYRSDRQADALQEYQRTRRTLDDQLGIEPSPALQRLERAILNHDAALEPVIAERHAYSVPLAPTPLLGRSGELADAQRLLTQDGVRLLTFTGPGGIGKTRLALELAHRLAVRFADGAAFVELAPVRSAALVAPTIARALRVATSRSSKEALERFLSDHELLLVLDNFEHLLDAAPLVAALAAAAPRLKTVATSRAPLHIAAEHEFEVPPLELDGGRDTHRPSPAVALFVQRARAVRRDFALTDESATAVAEICARLDGLPLAIELAAARSKLLPPQAMLERLGSRLDLTGGARDAPERQQTLRTTIDWSYGLLSGEERRLFARLAVFAGGWTLEAAEAVCGDEDVRVLDALSSLVDNSLVRQGGNREPRFAMLETVREYAIERLREAGEDDSLQRRHADFYVAFAEQAEPHLLDREQSVWLTRLEAERDNLRAAVAFAVERGDAETALRLASASRRFWHLHAHLAEGRAWLDAALNLRETTPSVLRVKVLNGAGTLAARQGDLDAAERLITESFELAQELGERQRAATALNGLANLRLFRGDNEEAERLYTQSAELSRELRDRRLEAIAVENLGSLKLVRGEVSAARVLLEQAGELAHAAGDPRDVSSIERSLARVRLAEGRHDVARSLLADAVRVSRDLGLKIELAESLELGAEVAAASCDAHACARLLGAADSLRSSIGSPREPPYDDFWCQRTAAKARQLLSDAAFDEAYAQGLALTTEEAVKLALDQTSSSRKPRLV